MNELIEFVNDIIDSYKEEAELNIYERSSNVDDNLDELENECENWKNEFKEKLSNLIKSIED